VSIVCIGDSLTFGYGVDKSQNWVSILSTRIEEKIINKGVPGNTTFEMKERFLKDVVHYMPSKVLIKKCNIEEYYLEDVIHVSKEIHKKMAEIVCFSFTI